MNKLWILFLLLTTVAFGQGKDAASGNDAYREYRKKYVYRQSEKYKGPVPNQYSSPASMEEVQDEQSVSRNITYSRQGIQRARDARRKGGLDRGGSTGTKPYDPEISEPEPIEIDPPDIDPPDVDLPDVDGPVVPPGFWYGLLIFIALALVAWIIYLIVRRSSASNQPVSAEFTPGDWNPEIIPKTELELRLEAAELRGDYRECVRIWFTFILKECIRLGRIKWKKELTNFDYLIQARASKGYEDFEESVRIYDLVWYGEYEITREEYQEVLPHLEEHYKQLSAENE